MRCLQGMLRVLKMDRMRNDDGKQRIEVERKLPERVDQRVLRWYEHMVRMDEECMIKRAWKAEVSEVRGAGGPHKD